MTPTVAIPLLTADQEARLAREIEAGVLAEHLLATNERPINASDAELSALVAQGREAWQRFLLANLRLVWKLAGREARRTGLSVDELFQEGFIALAGTLQRFDPERGRFSTYATYRVGQHLAAVSAARFGELAMPASRALRLRRARGVQAMLGQQRGREATAEEVAADLECSVDLARGLVNHQAPLSLDAIDLTDKLADPRSQDADESLHRLQVARVVRRLPGRQRSVVELRYGLVSGEPASVAEVAQRLRISVRSVRALEQQALAELRRWSAELRVEEEPVGAAS